jgi:hypothetical protein
MLVVVAVILPVVCSSSFTALSRLLTIYWFTN